ncbi:MAG: AAA family ATPase [Parvibaculaceae bacterium]
MRLENVTISNFRCFGPAPITMAVAREITAIVGPNAAGKTALLHALSKLFGSRGRNAPCSDRTFTSAPTTIPTTGNRRTCSSTS